MKILMSAFSCGPGKGSEPGVGWNMALETARLGHDVLVLTQTEYRAEIEREIAAGTVPPNLRFDIFSPAWLDAMRDFGLRHGLFSTTWHAVNICWQFFALARARRHCARESFDLLHHVTLAGFRSPTLLGELGLPMVLGPLGGGEGAPMALRKSISWRDWLANLIRDAHGWLLRFDPISRSAFRNADIIYLRSKESLVAVPPRFRGKAHFRLGMGVADVEEAVPRRREKGAPFEMIFVGRLVYWKGVHFAIRALARARSEGADAQLTIAGEGPAQGEFMQLAQQLAVADHISWRGEISRGEVFALYRRHHAFLFPSLHDAVATVTLEALAHGLPVVCLKGGGLGEAIDETCGLAVPVEGLGEDACIGALAERIGVLAADEDRRLALSHGAVARYRQFRWPNVVAELYADIAEKLAQDGVIEKRKFEAARNLVLEPRRSS